MGTPARLIRKKPSRKEEQPVKNSRRFQEGDPVRIGHEDNLRDAPAGEVTSVVSGGYYVAYHLGDQLRNEFFLRTQVHPAHTSEEV